MFIKWKSLVSPCHNKLTWSVNTLKLLKNEHHFADDIFKLNFLYALFWLKLPWNLFPKIQSTINQHWFTWTTSLAVIGQQAIIWIWWPSLLMHIFITQPKYVNIRNPQPKLKVRYSPNVFGVLIRQQAIIWTNDGLVYCRIYIYVQFCLYVLHEAHSQDWKFN